MTDRERLLDILNKPIFPHELVDPLDAVADYLLDNGVTVQQWISVEDRLPEEDLHCLVFQTYSNKRDGYVSLATYFPRFKGLEGDPMNSKQAWCKYSSEYGYYDVSESVTHWMPLPEPPKEA